VLTPVLSTAPVTVPVTIPRIASLAQAEIEQALGGAPRVRENSLRRALWRSLLLPAGDVLRAYLAGLDLWKATRRPTQRRACHPLRRPPGDGLYVVITWAILGDMRASALVADLIEGRVGRRRKGTQ
jgi:hypothetical protein